MHEPLTLNGVFAVPPLARTADQRRAIDFEENLRIVRHIASGGITRLIYGGNAFLYHVTLAEYEQILEWQSHLQREGLWFIVSAGPSFGRLMDQAPLLRRFGVSCVMVLPCGDPRDPSGIGQGLREFAEAEQLRTHFLSLEDLRDRWGPARVLHHAVELAGIAKTGAIPPFVSSLSIEQQKCIQPIAQQLVAREQK